MPYIIETYTTDREHHGVSWPAFPTRTAVATLDGARATAKIVVDNLPPDHSDRDWSEHYAAAVLSESGGTIGPLPDGTVVEVRRVDWMDFERMVVPRPVAATTPITTFDDDDYRASLITAFNARG